MLTKIKNVLKIIISILIITSFIKSCANAWTYNEFIEYLEQVSTSPEASTAFKNSCAHVLRYENNLSAKIDKTCDNYVIYNGSTTGWIGFYAYKGEIPGAYFSTNSLQFNTTTMNSYTMNRRDGSMGTPGTASVNHLDWDNVIGLVNIPLSLEENIPSKFWLQNRYVTGFEFEPINTTKVTYNGYNDVNAKKVNYINGGFVLGRISKFDENYDYYKFIFLDTNGNQIAYCNYHRGDTFYSGQNMSYYPSNNSVDIQSRLIYLNNIYTLSIYASDTQINDSLTNIKDSQVFTYVFLNENAVIENGTITSLGSGDTYSTQESTNDQISWWQKTVDKVFTVQSGDVKGKIEKFYNEMGYSSGDVSGELQEALAGLDVIKGEFTDFKISWDSYNPNLTVKGININNQGNMIPSGEVNFSKIERENPIIQDVMKYVRAILSFSIFVLLGKNIWSTLMITLGISPSIYDKATEEKRTAQQNEERWQQELEKQRYNEWLKNHRK